MATTSSRISDFSFRISDCISSPFAFMKNLQSAIQNLASKMKKAMSYPPMAFFFFVKLKVSDSRRQWAGRRGTADPEGAEAPG